MTILLVVCVAEHRKDFVTHAVSGQLFTYDVIDLVPTATCLRNMQRKSVGE
jgi:hypothetical protein